MNRSPLYGVALATATCLVLDAHAASRCEALASLSTADVVISTAHVVPTGSFQPPSGAAIQDLPEFCRVAGQIRNHPTSRITFEVWMPTQTANARFVQVGNGGFAGTIQYAAMAPRLRQGYVTASTDDGTSPAPGVPANQMASFLGDFERLFDFKGRATTLTTGVAKLLFRTFYGKTPAYSYFTGCSSGGLEALAVVQRIGDQFDGVSAGAPANDSAGLFTQALWNYKYYQKVETKLKLVHDAVLAACDKAGDGVEDGVVGNPEQCEFDPGVLACKASDQPNCLTGDQVDAVRKIYEGPVNPRTGTKSGEGYAPGMPRGSELGWGVSKPQATFGSAPWYGMVLHNTLTLDFEAFNFDADVSRALALTRPYGAQVTNADIDVFKRHGGKLILWAGWNDPLWSQQNIVDYYRAVVNETGTGRHRRGGEPKPNEGALKQTQHFARLFMSPGTGHCAAADVGPNSFDTFAPLVDWVESGKAPRQIIATKYVNNEPLQGVAQTRPLCAYPRVARWLRVGDPNSAANFECVKSHADDDDDDDR